jgi:hypothetical protein
MDRLNISHHLSHLINTCRNLYYGESANAKAKNLIYFISTVEWLIPKRGEYFLVVSEKTGRSNFLTFTIGSVGI